LEVAATARQLGLEVEVIEPLPVCLQGPLGRTIGERVMHLQTAHGVRLRNEIGVRRLIGDQEQGSSGAVTAVELLFLTLHLANYDPSVFPDAREMRLEVSAAKARCYKMHTCQKTNRKAFETASDPSLAIKVVLDLE
jgi:Pyridine nucleotide-disulphide oxidoreductase